MKFIINWFNSWFKKPEPIKTTPPPVKKEKKEYYPKCFALNKVSYSQRIAKDKAHFTKLRAYKCEFCPHWHLTSKKRYK